MNVFVAVFESDDDVDLPDFLYRPASPQYAEPPNALYAFPKLQWIDEEQIWGVVDEDGVRVALPSTNSYYDQHGVLREGLNKNHVDDDGNLHEIFRDAFEEAEQRNYDGDRPEDYEQF